MYTIYLHLFLAMDYTLSTADKDAICVMHYNVIGSDQYDMQYVVAGDYCYY